MEESKEEAISQQGTPQTEEQAQTPATLSGVDIDQQQINANSRMTPEYKAMLEAKIHEAEELEKNSRNMPLPESETDKKKKTLELQINNQKKIIEANKMALFGKKAKVRRAAQQKLEELEKAIAQL